MGTLLQLLALCDVCANHHPLLNGVGIISSAHWYSTYRKGTINSIGPPDTALDFVPLSLSASLFPGSIEAFLIIGMDTL